MSKHSNKNNKKSNKKNSNPKSNVNKLKGYLKKIKYLVFDDESIFGWIAAFVFMFLLLKLIVMPLSGLVLNTDYPIVAVISGSMEHKLDDNGFICGVRPLTYEKNFDGWWNTCGSYYQNNYNITKEEFLSFPQKNGFNIGDVMFLYGSKPKNLKIGDIIVFEGGRDKPIIHRIVSIEKIDNKYYYTTKGDHNAQTYDFETNISEDKFLGKSILKIPLIGYIKIIFFRFIESIANLF